MNDSRQPNIVAKRVVLEEGHFALFDQLPPVVRKELANAPYPMAAGKIVEWMRECRAAGMDDYAIADLILFRFRQYLRDKVKAECRELYGPEHPQSGPQ
jgi:hypothetical protein